MSELSIYNNIKTTQVDVGNANKFQSARFLNTQYNICPTFGGKDGIGRSVGPDSYLTKKAGCNPSLDRMIVENDQRPGYIVNLNIQRGLYSMTKRFAQQTPSSTDTSVQHQTNEVKKTVNGAETYVRNKYRTLNGMTKYY